MSGELSVHSIEVNLVNKSDSQSSSLVVSGENAFSNSALQITVNEKPVLVSLEAEQVELLLKLMGLVEYAGE